MSLTSRQRVSRRAFALGAAGLAAVAGFSRFARAQSTPMVEETPVAPEDQLIFRINSVGGLRPMETLFLQVANISIYADGTVIQPALVTAIYPPVAIAPLNALKISESALADLVARAKAAHLDQPQEIGNSIVMDAGTAEITFFVDGKRVISRIYALHVNGPQPPEWDEATETLFKGIREVADFAQNLSTSLDAADIIEREHPYEVDQLQVIAFVPDEANPLPTGVPDITAPPLIWPLEESLAEIGAVYDPLPDTGLPALRCAEVSGDDARAVIAVAAQGNFISPWIDRGPADDQTTIGGNPSETPRPTPEGVLYGILFNPLLPGDSSCQTFG